MKRPADHESLASAGADDHPIVDGEEGLCGASLTPGLGRDFPLRLELVLAEGQSNEATPDSPFLVLSDYGGASRVYLGRIRSGHPSSDRHVAVKMQMGPPPGDAAEDYGGLLTHRNRQRRWSREMANYLSLAGARGGFTPVFFIEPALERSGETSRPRPWPPLLYCRRKNLLFRPLTERGTPLATCRDSALLIAHGLPPYENSVETFLYNEEEVKSGAAPVFYQNASSLEAAYPNVKSLAVCIQELARIPGMPGAQPPDLSTTSGVIAFANLCASFPLLTDPARETLFPNGSLAQQIMPFSFEDTNALVMELNRFHYDEFCDLLGGIGEKAFRNEYLGEGVGPAQRLRLGNVKSFFEGGPRLMFDAEVSGMDALEVFRLKWTLWTQACQAVSDFHRCCGVAHLRIEPSHVMVQTCEPSESVPSLWQFQARLISLGATALEPRPDEGLAEEIPVPPSHGTPLYQSDIIGNSSFGMVQNGAFTMTSLDEGERAGEFILACQISHEGIGLSRLSPRDRVKVILRHVLGVGNLSFFAARDPNSEYSHGTLFLKSGPLKLADSQQKGLKQIQNKRIHKAGFALYPLFGVPCDIYSLGMLLFRTLVVNDGQAMGDVALALEALKKGLPARRPEDWEADAESEFLEKLIEHRPDGDFARVFGRAQVFHNRDDRDPERPNAIPPSIWNEAMVLGLQMITNIDGFSICADHADFGASYPAARTELLVRRAREILREIDVLLFSKTERNAEIRAALDLILTEKLPA